MIFFSTRSPLRSRSCSFPLAPLRFPLRSRSAHMLCSKHITYALVSPHCLRVPERILFKVAVLTYRAVNGSARDYLSSYFTRVANVPSRLRLRSSNSDQLMVPSYSLTTVGRRAFPVFAANFWNSLPVNLPVNYLSTVAHDFRQRLETRLFRRSYPDLII